MKKYLIAFAFIILIGPLILYCYTKMASAHPVAVAAIRSDSAVVYSLGEPQTAILIGIQFRGSGAYGCSSLIYYVLGRKNSGAVNVRLERRKPENWNVIELSLGFDTPFRRSCEYKS
jgi:hypothetical protein